MKITESQLKRIINEEIGKMLNEEGDAPAKPMSTGEKKAAKAGEATSLTGWATAAAQVGDAPGLAALIQQAIASTRLKDDRSKILTALQLVRRELA
jgi:hypothetical protein